MLSSTSRILAACLLCAAVAPVSAGTVHFHDGSVLQGEIKSLADGKLTVATSFTDKLIVPLETVRGLVTDKPLIVTMENGDEVRGRLDYAPDTGQRIGGAESGSAAIEIAHLAGLRPPGVQQVNLWSGQLLLGIGGSSGNSTSRNINFGANAQRETERARLYLSLLVNKARQDGTQTVDETLGTIRLERDFSERFFVFVQTEGEKDEFENIDFRSTTTVGPGYYFIQEPDQTLKGRLGLGYEYMDPVIGDDVSEVVVTFGYDYMVAVRDWFRLTHELTVLPQVSNDPGENFRVDSVLGAQAPLGPSPWSLLAQYRHEYNNNPEPGVEDLDTSYLLNLVRNFE